MPDATDLKNRFAYHAPPNEATREVHRDIRSALYLVAKDLNELLPEGREKALVITHLEEAMMWANAAIARVNPITEEPA